MLQFLFGRPGKARRGNCRRKFRHLHYLSALQQAQSLAEEGIVIYPCSECHGLHLGHNKVLHGAPLSPEQERRASLLARIEKHRVLMAEHKTIIDELKAELEG